MAKENSGFISNNKYKKEDKHPDLKGKINVEGKEFEIAGWKNKNDNGEYFSLKLSEPRVREEAF